ncbi:leukotoxin LktA family filamentous adhesin, partial [Aquabacterium sp.]|uniref:leukotoxin LktA family filamentous adhesin n=1 Tax=Aquabacterium sp. TaxID=1872578 RepID=UPI0024892DCE
MSHGAITLVRRQYLAILRRCASLNASGWMALGGFSAGLGLLTGGVAQAAGPGIVTDGRTQTAVTPVGGNQAVIDVTTQTVKGVNGFNSFSQFSVYGGQTVNLHVPQGAANLLNLVNGPQSQIDGVLNAYKDGRIGGNVFFFNPLGIVVGAGGQVNVGSLMLATPTQAYMDRLMDGQGRIDDAALAEALAGRVPLSASGLISVKGQVRAIDGALLAAGRVEVAAGGQVQAGGAVRVAFGQLVNVDGLKEGGVSFLEGDTVRIVASGDVDVAGRVSADGAGTGAAAQGGRVHVWAEGTARLLQGG